MKNFKAFGLFFFRKKSFGNKKTTENFSIVLQKYFLPENFLTSARAFSAFSAESIAEIIF